MSVEASSWAFAQGGLPTGAKFLLVAIGNRADKAGIAFPGRESLAEDCCCRPETVTENLKRLEADRLIVRFPRRRRNGSRTSDWIVLAPLAADRSPMVDASEDEVPANVAEVARESSGEETQGEEISGEVGGLGQVRKTGGPPEPSVERNGSGSPANAGEPEPVRSAKADRTASGKGNVGTATTDDSKVKRPAAETNRLVKELFEFWQAECDHPRAQLSDGRRAKLKARLKDSTPREIGQAIRGAARAAYINDDGKRYDELTLICRNREKLEDFVERYELSERGGAAAARKARSVVDRTADRLAEAAA